MCTPLWLHTEDFTHGQLNALFPQTVREEGHATPCLLVPLVHSSIYSSFFFPLLFFFHSFFLIARTHTGLDCYYWSSSLVDGAVKHACAGDDVIFPWKVTLGPEEHLLAVQWTFQGRSNEIVAMLHSGRFLPMSSYNGRVRRVAEEGLSLSGVTAGDSGLYTVVVTVQNTNGDTVTIRHKVDLHVTGE